MTSLLNQSRNLRVVLLHDFDEGSLFGVRFYGERLRAAVMPFCSVTDVFPRPPAAPARLRGLVTFVMKEFLYPRQVRLLRGDVFHVIDQSHATLLDGLPAQATVVTCHDLHPLTAGNRLRRAAYRRRVLRLNRARRLVADSEDTRRALLRLGCASERIVVVRIPVDGFFLQAPDPEELESVARRYGLERRGFFLHVGNSLPYKNLDRLLCALGEIEGAPLLVKAGAFLPPAEARRAAVLGVRVLEVGAISQRELRALYHLARALLYPSLHEGYGWPVAEAMACGLAVVASHAGALAEVSAGAALEVDPHDVASIAEACRRVAVDDRLTADLAERARERGRQLTGADFAATMLGVYEEVASG